MASRNALEMSALDHMRMSAAVQPFVDTAISKTVNVPVDYPFEAFKDLYFEAWKAGLKGIATYRPNSTLGAVLEVAPSAPPAAAPQDFDTADPDRRWRPAWCLGWTLRRCRLAGLQRRAGGSMPLGRIPAR